MSDDRIAALAQRLRQGGPSAVTPCPDARAEHATPTDRRTAQESAYDALLRAHGQQRVALLAHALQEARSLAGATEGLFWDDLACAVLWCNGEGALHQLVERMLERMGGALRCQGASATTYLMPTQGRALVTMATATGRQICQGLPERAAAGDWPWRLQIDPAHCEVCRQDLPADTDPLLHDQHCTYCRAPCGRISVGTGGRGPSCVKCAEERGLRG